MEECKVSVRGRGPAICPAGCAPARTDAQDALATLLAFARTFAEFVPKRKGFFRKRWVCRACGADLVLGDPEHREEFTVPLPSGAGLEIRVTGPGHRCISCGRTHYKVLGGSASYRELAGPIMGALGEGGGTPPPPIG
jgi:hypothetical protein